MAKRISYKPPPQTLDWLGQIFLGAQAGWKGMEKKCHVEVCKQRLKENVEQLPVEILTQTQAYHITGNRGLFVLDGIAFLHSFASCKNLSDDPRSLRIGAYAQAFEHSLP